MIVGYIPQQEKINREGQNAERGKTTLKMQILLIVVNNPDRKTEYSFLAEAIYQ